MAGWLRWLAEMAGGDGWRRWLAEMAGGDGWRRWLASCDRAVVDVGTRAYNAHMISEFTAKPTRNIEPLAIWSLGLAAVLLFPIAAVVGTVALVRIYRGSKPRAGGAVMAGMAVFVSAVVAPYAVVAAFNGRGPVTNTCVRVQQEARGALRVISFLEKRYKKNTGRYGNIEEIGFPLDKAKGPYKFTVDWADKFKFVASATGFDLMKGDLMQVDNSEKVNLVTDRCSEFKRNSAAARRSKKTEPAGGESRPTEARPADSPASRE